MDTEQQVRASFAQQAIWCRELGSPFTALLLEQAGQRLHRATRTGQRVLDWPESPHAHQGALALRFAGGLHALVRRGRLPDLAAVYPPNDLPDGPTLWASVAAAMADADGELSPWLDSAPQTNEVARSAALWAGLMVVAGHTGLPLSLFELGASAGLNLVPDRYAYRLGPTASGCEGSALLLAPEWRGAAPRVAEVRIAGRRGADLNPLDPGQAADRERLLAYIWADQPARLARAEAAMSILAADPPAIDRADAADWTEAMLHPRPEEGMARVLMHSIAFQYFPPESQSRIRAHVQLVGERATATAPFAWLRLEVERRFGTMPSLLLTLWPDGTERFLASASAHGSWVDWRGANNQGDGA